MATETLNAYQLANLAGVLTPDSLDSPGAVFLCTIQEDVSEALRFGIEDDENDAAHEIADGCVPVYTFKMWQTFTDLAAWQEDISDFGSNDKDDMTQRAMTCLYMIAYRLALTLIQEAQA